ncbi:MAG: endonuclease/exonuclease/phosphatase family protein, partial [Bacteroidales bacterium]|nr:endonuclease/exonuclease/phosphatase family protein [Bacteroidales bacterium]
ARKNGLALIVERIAAMNPKGYPMILTGDFNMRPQRPEFENLKKVMKDARVTARTTDTGYTFSGWKINPSSESVIDYVWYSGFSDCPEYHVVRKEYGVPFVSDHFPIMATLVF